MNRTKNRFPWVTLPTVIPPLPGKDAYVVLAIPGTLQFAAFCQWVQGALPHGGFLDGGDQYFFYEGEAMALHLYVGDSGLFYAIPYTTSAHRALYLLR